MPYLGLGLPRMSGHQRRFRAKCPDAEDPSSLCAGVPGHADGLGDFKGDVHAFSDPDSNSGWLVTTATPIA